MNGEKSILSRVSNCVYSLISYLYFLVIYCFLIQGRTFTNHIPSLQLSETCYIIYYVLNLPGTRLTCCFLYCGAGLSNIFIIISGE